MFLHCVDLARGREQTGLPELVQDEVVGDFGSHPHDIRSLALTPQPHVSPHAIYIPF